MSMKKLLLFFTPFVYIVFIRKGGKEIEFKGVFFMKNKAIKACETENCLWVKVKFNFDYGIDTIDCPKGDYDYPLWNK